MECGGCGTGLVCNLATNACGQPQVTCAELGAQCGTLRNSCGRVQNCGSCPDPSQECDRNTKTCVDCTHVTAADLGYQCGLVNLGCGPASTKVDAGTCPSGATCNDALKICEPQCSPETAQIICAVASADCGQITNGCGGMVDCGGCDADAGLFCGARGINNRCDLTELPNECIAAHRNCGSYTSACGPPEVNCGTCTDPEVCNPNGRCGLPCSPVTCDSPELVGKCGTGLDAGCEVSLDCACGNGLLCSTSQPRELGTCNPPSECTAFGANGAAGSPCSNDPSPLFPSGGGTSLACSCSGTGVCVDGAKHVVALGDAGTCCVNTAACQANVCGTSVVDTCTGAVIPCTCTAAGTFCLADAGVCVPTRTCTSYGANGDAGNPCSNGPSAAFPKNSTENLTCSCTTGGLCNVPDGGLTQAPWGSKGACCFNTATCAPNECGTQKSNTCTGGLVTCACTNPSTYCDTAAHVCRANPTCLDFNADGGVGSNCSNGPAFVGPTGSLTCPCASGNVCVSGTTVVSGDAKGTCCHNTAACGNTCNTSVANTCTGQPITCACGSGFYCSSTTDAGVCLPYFTCTTYGATGLQGQVCSTSANSAFDRYPDDATGLTCNCTQGRFCSVDAGVPDPHLADAGELGSCCTNTNLCGTSCNTSVANSCTSQVSACACSGSSYCSTDAGPGSCLPYWTCSFYGADGGTGAPCSTSNNTAFSRYPGDTTGRTCGCASGRVCSMDGGTANAHLAGAGEIGACCVNTAVCPANTCVTLKNTCTGANIACGCTSGSHCVGGGAPGSLCVPNQTCSSYGATGAVGASCSTVPSSVFHDAADGGFLTCPCSTTAPYTRNTCVGSSSTDAGICSCTPSTPANCSDNGKSDGCGGLMVSTCGSTQVCYNSACCTPPVCPAGNAGDVCGTISACGQSVTCGCIQTYPNTSCGAIAAGFCGCKAYTTDNCGGHPLTAGVHSDGCTGFVTCQN